MKAMVFAAQHRLPLVRVHHMEAHALVARLADAYQPVPPTSLSPAAASPADPSTPGILSGTAVALEDAARCGVPFPFLCLLVSGGHNLVVLVQGVGQYVQLGTTVDDALGKCLCICVSG